MVAPPGVFTVCQAEEPNTLFIYGRPSRAARNVLEAIYDGPIDTLTYRSYPVILTKLPSLSDGDAALRAVEATEGDLVVDTSGQTVILRPGTVVLDSEGQETRFSGSVVSMTQMVVSFTLRADVTWADGEPVTADDSRFSYELARRLADTPLRVRLLVDQTLSYNAVDEHMAVWTSIPGYRDSFSFQGFHLQNFYYGNFYQPLPRHVWGSANASQLAKAEVAHRYPLGWGPFVVQEWVDGDHITLVRNPHYFRAAEGLPYLDQVDVRFVSDLAEALSLLVEGECDLIAQDVIEREAANSGTLAPLLEAAELGIVKLEQAASTEWEHLDFGVQRSEWVDEPAFFANRRTRQAVAMCVHRERIVGEAVPYGMAVAADSYVAMDHPLYGGIGPFTYDPSTAIRLLDEIGWRDEDGDGVREAQDVTGVESGTPLSMTLLTSSDHLAHERVARVLVENLAACGIRLDVEYMAADKLFADGPYGPVFGRAFDLALFSWLNELDAPCWLYLTSEIPQAENWWATSNNPGYSSARFDTACTTALASFPGTEPYVDYHQRAQRIFVRDLPVLPLYFVPKLVAVRPDVTGVVLDPTEELELWTIETFNVARGSGR
jgi:peptide/nickel transport system substrate-binding protein